MIDRFAFIREHSLHSSPPSAMKLLLALSIPVSLYLQMKNLTASARRFGRHTTIVSIALIRVDALTQLAMGMSMVSMILGAWSKIQVN